MPTGREADDLAATAATTGGPLAGVSACRIVTWSESARKLLMGQLMALNEMRWSLVTGDPYVDPPPGLTLHHVPMRRELALSDLRSFWRLYRFLRNHRFAFVQTHTPKASLLGLPAARLAGLPTVYTMHGCLYFQDNSRLGNLAGWVFERWCCSWAHRVLAQSREDVDILPKARICRADKVLHLGNGIDLRRFSELAGSPRANEPPVVLMISRLVAEKGCRDFFRVAEALHSKARFVHVGYTETDQRDAITRDEQLAVAEAGHVVFVGAVDDVRPYLAEADLVLLPSYREGIPRVAMEAGAAGRAVAAYDVRGVREVIPPRLGLLVQRGDVEAMIELVADLLADRSALARLGSELQAWVTAEFSEEAVVERARQAYRELLSP